MSTENATSSTSTPAAPSSPAPAASAPATSSGAAAPSSSAPATSLEALKAKAQSAQAGAKAEASGSESSIDPSAQVDPAAPPTFTPNYKYKVGDDEHEIEEMYRSLMKDAETEKKIREMHEKARGLDWQKPKYEKLKTEHQEVSTKYQNLDRSLQTLSKFVQNDDLGSFFEGVNIPKQKVFEYVKKELEKMEASPEQRAIIEQQETERKKLFNLQQENEELRSRYSSESTQARVMELDTALSRPEVTSIASQFDAKMGSGAFKREVINRGILAFQTQGIEIPVLQAVSEAVAQWSPLFAQAQQTPAGEQSPESPAPQAFGQPKPVMPNLGGRSTSPLKSGPRSIADLKKISQQINRNQN